MASDPEGFCELYRDYLSDAEESLKHLRVACENGRGDDVRAKAHYLKSSSLVLGITAVAELCKELEDAALLSNVSAAHVKVERLSELLRDVRVELEKRLGPRVIPAAA